MKVIKIYYAVCESCGKRTMIRESQIEEYKAMECSCQTPAYWTNNVTTLGEPYAQEV